MDIAVSFWWVDIPPRSKVDFSALAQMGYFDRLLFPLSLPGHPGRKSPRASKSSRSGSGFDTGL